MSAFILNLIGILFVAYGCIVAWSSLLDKKINYKSYKIYVSIFIFLTLLMLNYNNMAKFTINTIILAFIAKMLFSERYKTGFLVSFCTQTLAIVFEIIFSILAIYIFKIDFSVNNLNTMIILFADLFVCLGIIMVTHLKVVKKVFKHIIKIIDKIKAKYILLALLPVIFIFNIYIEMSYYKIGDLYIFILNNVTIYVIVIIILLLAKRETEYIKINEKYNVTIKSLKEYEKILDDYRVFNHENKNQLLTIRGLASSKNKKLIDYIDEITKNKINDDEKLMNKLSIIPSGGLRGLMYSKILYMNQKNIKNKLNFSKNISGSQLIKSLENSDILDICQVLGVYLDNSIEASENMKKRLVNIDVYVENGELCFEISNLFEGNFDIDKLEEKGYTTKGKNHGYGLSLAKEVIDNNKKLKNIKKINKNVFTQVLKIKL